MGKKLAVKDAAARLSCSTMQIRRFVSEGKLHLTRERPVGHSRVWLDADEVAELARTWRPKRARASTKARDDIVNSNVRGPWAARAYEMFRRNASDVDVVIALELDPLLVRQFREEYDTTPETARKREREREAQAAERQHQREHNAIKRAEVYAQMQIRKAEIEARARVTAADIAARAARASGRGSSS